MLFFECCLLTNSSSHSQNYYPIAMVIVIKKITLPDCFINLFFQKNAIYSCFPEEKKFTHLLYLPI